MKLLVITNKVKAYSLGFQNMFEVLLSLGHDVIWAANFKYFVGDNINSIPVKRKSIPIDTNPLNRDNIKAYKEIINIIDQYEIEGILCSTPIGGALGRLAGRRKRINAVLYAAHGFLFFKGAPLINRTVYKLEETILAHYTDYLITITEEDFKAAQKLKIRGGKKPYFVHGAGINVGVKVEIDRLAKRREIGVPENSLVIVSAGELNKNKNTEVIVKAMEAFREQDVHYVVCGVGPEEENLRKLARKLGVNSQIHLMGYRTDMPEIMAASDIFTMMSFREGMPRAVLEAMDLGLPCVGSDTRGVRDLIDKNGGIICKPTDSQAFSKAFRKLIDNPEIRKRMGEYNRGKVQGFSSAVVKKELYVIYKEAFSNERG